MKHAVFHTPQQCRRMSVAKMHKRGESVDTIAFALECSATTVRDDLAFMNSYGVNPKLTFKSSRNSKPEGARNA